MKGKRYTTEDKIRILRSADGGKSIVEVCQEKNISEVTYHRWKRQFGQMDVNEARHLKELERENTELKKMLAEALLAKRVLEYVIEKNYEPEAQEAANEFRCNRRVVFRARGVPYFTADPSDVVVPGRGAQRRAAAVGGATA